MSEIPQAVEGLRAGGGGPSTVSAAKKIRTLSEPVLRHLKDIFSSLSKNGAVLSRADAVAFLDGIQGVESKESLSDVSDNDTVAFNDFLEYTSSPAFGVLAPPKVHDLSYPLSNYLISSSHNTYLTGNQLYGRSSVDGYKNVLLRGCRCIEIDVWDGDIPSPNNDPPTSTEPGNKSKYLKRLPQMFSLDKNGTAASKAANATTSTTGTAEACDNPTILSKQSPWASAARAEPQVLHGYTLTRQVPFREVCIAIRHSAFVTSDLPVIVSLEVHASLEQQEIMVEIMQEVWSDVLVDGSNCAQAIETLPSPGHLRNKILVKVKYVPPATPTTNATITGPPEQLDRALSASSTSEDENNPTAKGGKNKTKVLEALSKLGVYTQACHFSDLSQPEASLPTHVFSVSERALLRLHEVHAPTLFEHNRQYLMRTYPQGWRVSSSNLDPSLYWRKGVQMVALNWQKWDAGMMLNEGMFASEGGWVLKPKGYRATRKEDGDVVTPGVLPAAPISHKTLDLKIEVFAGQNIPLPEGDDDPKRFCPYLKCELHVEDVEESSQVRSDSVGKPKGGKMKRRTRTQKGINPDFRGEVLIFTRAEHVVEELSFLRFKIHDDEIGKDDLAAWACVRLDRLRPGYRFVHLLDTKGVESPGIILVRIHKDFVA